MNRLAACLLMCLVAGASPLAADSKAETLKPLQQPAAQTTPAAATTAEKDLRAQLEVEYRAALEQRLAQERKSYEASLQSLWASNAAVWAVLLGFVAWQALGARKLARELARARAQHETSAKG